MNQFINDTEVSLHPEKWDTVNKIHGVFGAINVIKYENIYETILV